MSGGNLLIVTCMCDEVSHDHVIATDHVQHLTLQCKQSQVCYGKAADCTQHKLL